MILRPYQNDCKVAVQAALTTYDSALVEMATGLGKTVVFASLSADWPGRCLVLAHREELVYQAMDKVARATCGDVTIEMASSASDESSGGKRKIVVGSVQTLCRPKRLERFNPGEFGLVVVDEAHHAVAHSYRTILNHFRKNERCKLLGVTATPLRADKLALGQVFESVAYRYGISDAIDDGWLVPVRQRVVRVDGLDFSKLHTVAGDFDQAELAEVLLQEDPLHRMVSPLVELAGDAPTLVFCVNVKHARKVDAVLNRYKPGSSRWLSGETPKEERREVVAAYKKGGVQFLCNCALFLEGFDAPKTAVVAMMRCTKSLTVYTQVLGRSTRPLPGVVDGLADAEARRAAIAASGKPAALVVDFAGNAGQHKIVTAADVLGGKYGEPVRHYARNTLEEEGTAAPVADALERAEAEMTLEAEEQERRRRIVVRAVYRTEDVSPFDRAHRAERVAPQGFEGREMATSGQVWYLTSQLGVSEGKARSFTRKQARYMIAKLKAERGLS